MALPLWPSGDYCVEAWGKALVLTDQSPTGFADSAEDISFEIEEDQPILRASLYNGEGELVDGVINLTERIGNNDGEFVFDG